MCRIFGVQRSAVKKKKKEKKDSPTFKKKKRYHVPVHEFAYQWYERNMAFTLSQTNITSQSEVFALINMRCA